MDERRMSESIFTLLRRRYFPIRDFRVKRSIGERIQQYVRRRMWFGRHWTSMCPMHSLGHYESRCHQFCRTGRWVVAPKPPRYFGRPIWRNGKIVGWSFV